MNDLVSIITPCYNSISYIAQSIESVLSQTYHNWEMIIVDDCSTDGSFEIINRYAKSDNRIKVYKTEYPSGSPVLPRNIAIKNAVGRYIAFLDSDDMWLPKKLEEQIHIFKTNLDTAVVFSYYEKISEDGKRQNRIVKSPKSVTYNKLLYGNVIGCLTGIYDTFVVGKIYMKNIGHEDYAMWLNILKNGGIASNTNNVQALYRVRESSVSSNKLTAFRWTWNIYINIEHLGYIKSVYCFMLYAIKAVIKNLI